MEVLNNLPDEIIEIIISYLPRHILETLSDIPVIGKFAERLLYSTIRIDDSAKYPTPFQILQNGRSVRLRSPLAFVKLLESNPNIVPKKLLFEDPFDALVLAREYPQSLFNVETELAFWFPSSYSPSYAVFAEEYRKTPFRVDSLVTRFGDRIEEIVGLELAKGVKAFSVVSNERLDLGRLFTVVFPNLTSLIIRSYLNLNDIRHIPQQLKSLACGLEPELDRGQDQPYTKLDLPKSLLDLEMTISGGGSHTIFDISHLTKLRKLKVSGIAWNADAPSNLVSLWRFPPSLRMLHVGWLEMIAENLSVACPQLHELKIENTLHLAEAGHSDKLSIPDSVQCLVMPVRLLSCEISSNSDEDPWSGPKLSLPSSLRELALVGNLATEDTVVLDCDSCDLDSLVLFRIPQLSIMGDMRSLTTLTLNASPVFDFEKLQYLENLSYLTIKDAAHHMGEFSYELPDSLSKLELPECGLTKVRIHAPRLTSLNLHGNCFQVLDDTTFRVPPKLRTLKVSGNSITSVSVTLPSTLESFNLEGNMIGCIDHLPDTLQFLYCSKNLLGESKVAPRFPVGLTTLALSDNQIDETWLCDSNLSECTRLKALDISRNKLPSLTPSRLPKSLTKLIACGDSISSFGGDLKDLENLEEVYLAKNKLRGYFADNAFGFGDRIKRVDINGNRATPSDVQALLNELSQKPVFEKLDVEPNSYPDTSNTSEFRPRSIARPS